MTARRKEEASLAAMLAVAMLVGAAPLAFVPGMSAGVAVPSAVVVPGSGAPTLRGSAVSSGSFAGAQGGAGAGGSALSCLALSALGAALVRFGAANKAQARRSRLVMAADSVASEWKGAEEFSALTESVALVSDNIEIASVLPHRYPFLLVDKIIAFEPGKRIVGVKNVTANEPQFTGHFPENPIMPGVLMVEAMAQLGGLVCLRPPISDGGGQFFFTGINGAKFRRPVVPGDTLVMEMELKAWRPKYGIAKMTGRAYVDGQLAVEVAEFGFALVSGEEK